MTAPGRLRVGAGRALAAALLTASALLPACGEPEPRPEPGAATRGRAVTRQAPNRLPPRGRVVYLPRQPPLLRSSVVLLGRDDGEVGAIEVRAGGKTTTVSGAWQGVNFDRPETVVELGQEAVEAAFADLLAAEPRPPADQDLYFALDSARPDPASRAALERLAEALAAWPAPAISIAGFADSSGSEEHNLDLSRRRALAVRDALTAAGVAEASIEVAWYGESRPVAGTAGVGELNRRVEVRVR